MSTHSLEPDDVSEPLAFLGNPLKIPIENHVVHSEPPSNTIWKRFKETTNIELYYDLYFVANLTSFTSQHDIGNRQTLSDYVGFFCVLWFTWLQVALFDMRFESNSFFDRFCKALQLAVMGGFAVTGWNFYPSEGKDHVHLHYFFTFSLILMASRLALCVQYLKVVCFAHAIPSRTKHTDRNTVFPLLLIVLSKLVSGVIYLGIAFGFIADEPRIHGYFSWYIVAIWETAFDFIVSCKFPVVNYENTHMVERMTLITLIVLGEGIIGATEATSIVFSSVGIQDDGKIIGQLVCGFLINYFLFFLYSDRAKEKEVGPIRQQIWTLMHFPFHISLVLLLAAVKFMIPWRYAIGIIHGVKSSIDSISQTTPDLKTLLVDINNTVQNLVVTFRFDNSIIDNAIAEFNATVLNSNLTDISDVNSSPAAKGLLDALSVSIFGVFEIEPPKTDTGPENPEGSYIGITKAYKTIYIYFFVTAGMTLIFLGVLGILSKRPVRQGMHLWPRSTDEALPNRMEMYRAAIRIVSGIMLSLLALIAVSDREFTSFIGSPWILPSVMLSYTTIIVVDYLVTARESSSSLMSGIRKSFRVRNDT